jgi:hypothetical protein
MSKTMVVALLFYLFSMDITFHPGGTTFPPPSPFHIDQLSYTSFFAEMGDVAELEGAHHENLELERPDTKVELERLDPNPWKQGNENEPKRAVPKNEVGLASEERHESKVVDRVRCVHLFIGECGRALGRGEVSSSDFFVFVPLLICFSSPLLCFVSSPFSAFYFILALISLLPFLSVFVWHCFSGATFFSNAPPPNAFLPCIR